MISRLADMTKWNSRIFALMVGASILGSLAPTTLAQEPIRSPQHGSVPSPEPPTVTRPPSVTPAAGLRLSDGLTTGGEAEDPAALDL